MKMLFIICEKSNKKKILKMLTEITTFYQVTINAKGTADEAMLTYYGIEKSEKQVVFTLVDSENSKLMLEKLSEEDFINKQGAVAFSVPMGQISQDTLNFFDKMEVNYGK